MGATILDDGIIFLPGIFVCIYIYIIQDMYVHVNDMYNVCIESIDVYYIYVLNSIHTIYTHTFTPVLISIPQSYISYSVRPKPSKASASVWWSCTRSCRSIGNTAMWIPPSTASRSGPPPVGRRERLARWRNLEYICICIYIYYNIIYSIYIYIMI